MEIRKVLVGLQIYSREARQRAVISVENRHNSRAHARSESFSGDSDISG